MRFGSRISRKALPQEVGACQRALPVCTNKLIDALFARALRTLAAAAGLHQLPKTASTPMVIA